MRSASSGRRSRQLTNTVLRRTTNGFTQQSHHPRQPRADPDIRESNGNAYGVIRVATSRRYKNRDGEATTETQWHSIAVYGRTAELAQQYLKKGSSALFEGRLRTRKYKDHEGFDRTVTEIVCESMQFVGSGKKKSEEQQETMDHLEEDVPF